MTTMVYSEPLTVGQAAHICRVCKKTVLNWIYSGGMKAFTTYGGHYRIWPANLKEFIDAAGMDIPFVPLDVRSMNVVVIDDNRTFSTMLSNLIADEFPGVEVRVARNGQEGLMLIGELQPRLVILDLEMPGMNGIETLRLLEKRKLDHRICVMVLSGSLDAHMKHEALTLGADCALDKLTDINFILRAVAGLIGRGKPVSFEVDPLPTQSQPVRYTYTHKIS